ncbi:MAG: hypothetical protein JNL11_12810 [Bdellovibrionaceae bacterium]|nr:hypothetical protein [Pseudobdellovibrionaceae bacterium]
MKVFFVFTIVALLSVLVLSQTNSSGPKNMATLSYVLPSQLDWEQYTGDGAVEEMQIYTLGDDHPIRLSATQLGNPHLWEQFASMDAEKIYAELLSGKKIIHSIAGYKNWQANKSIEKKSSKEIIFEITGHFEEKKEKNFFTEKYYVTPYGVIISSLNWTEKSNPKLAEKAQDDFEKIEFKSELR